MHPTTTSTELTSLAMRANCGDGEALERLLAGVHVRVLRFLRAWLHRRGDWEELAQDLAQDTLLRIARSLGGCQAATDAELIRWCLRVARNIGIDHLRAVRDEWDATALALDAGDGPLCQVHGSWQSDAQVPTEGARVLLAVLSEVLADEPEEAHELLWERLVAGSPWGSAGAALGVPETAAKRRFQRTQARIRVAVLRRLVSLPRRELAAVRRWFARLDLDLPALR
jgi:RNA polymerase sigma factor (sigma-70 family)